MAASTFAFACVAENGPDWFDKAYNLALSVRTFGGSLADAPVIVSFVGDVEREYATALEKIGAEVRVVERFHPRSPYLNKMRMLELAEDSSFDVLVALDCDVLVAGDIRDDLPVDRVAAKPADVDVLTDDQWSGLYRALDLEPPRERFAAATTGEPMYPYFNSGVVTVPHAMCRGLLDRWTGYVEAILRIYDEGPQVVPSQWQFHLDQFSLAVALAREEPPPVALPLRLNMPVHIDVHPSFREEITPPYVIHYHKNIGADGFVWRTKYEDLNVLLDEFNRARAAALGLSYRRLAAVPVRRRIRHLAVHGAHRLGVLRH
jgi:hypothetical protein